MEPSSDILMWLAGHLIVGAAIWGGIKADIKHMHERINENKARTEEAHRRIDQMLTSRKTVKPE